MCFPLFYTEQRPSIQDKGNLAEHTQVGLLVYILNNILSK
jgi:hypothetical protein